MISFCWSNGAAGRMVIAIRTLIVLFSLIAAVHAHGVRPLDDFLEACKTDDYHRVSAILRDDPGLVYVQYSGGSILHRAVKAGAHGITQLILDNRADIESACTCGHLALHGAVFTRRADMVALLLSYRAGINAVETVHGRTPLHLATEPKPHDSMQHKGDVNIARMLIEHKAHLNIGDDKGSTPLHLATLQNDEPMVALLLQHGADAAKKNSDGLTPLQQRFKQSKEHPSAVLVKLLAAADNSDPYHTCNRESLLQLECLACHYKPMIDEARADIAVIPNILVQVVRDSVTVLPSAVQTIVIHYCMPLDFFMSDIFSRPGSLPSGTVTHEDVEELSKACKEDDYGRAKVLLEKNPALVHADAIDRGSPLILAASSDAHSVVKLLLDTRAEVHMRNRGGTTALHCAAGNGNKDIVSLLLSRGADSNAIDANQKTPLLFATGAWSYNTKRSHIDSIRMLLASKALLESRDEYGCTPLHHAIYYARPPAAALLLCHKADLSLKNNTGDSSVHYALQQREPIFAALCIAAGASVACEKDHSSRCGTQHEGQPISTCDRCNEDATIATAQKMREKSETEIRKRIQHQLMKHVAMLLDSVNDLVAQYCTVDHLLLRHLSHHIFACNDWYVKESSPPNKRQKQ